MNLNNVHYSVDDLVCGSVHDSVHYSVDDSIDNLVEYLIYISVNDSVLEKLNESK